LTEQESYTGPKKAALVLAVLNGRNQRAHRSDLTSGKRTGRSARTRTRFLPADSNKLKLCAPKSKAIARTMMLMPPPLFLVPPVCRLASAASMLQATGSHQLCMFGSNPKEKIKKSTSSKLSSFFQRKSLGDAAMPMCNAAISV
jgi:hypothetical protein